MSDLLKSTISEELSRNLAILKRAEQIGVEEAAKFYSLHPSTIWKLQNRVAEGKPAFDRRRLNPGAASSVDNNRLGWTLAYMADHQGVALTVVLKELNKVAEAEKWPITRYSALTRAIIKLPLDMRVMLTEGGKAAFQKAGLVGKREQSRPLELVQMDASDMPIWTIHPATGQLIRPWMTGLIDGYSRVVLWLEFHLEKPDAVDAARAVTRAFLPKGDETMPFFGMAETLQTDNAQEYIGKLLTGVSVRSGFILDQVPLACPGANGKIERFFQTFQNGLLSRLAGYASQSHAKFKAEDRGVVPFEVIKSVSRLFLLEYHSSEHRGIGRTPWELWHEQISNAPGYFVPAAEIRRKLRISVTCDVTREGVTALGSNYSGKDLNGLVGSKIEVLCSANGGDQSVEAFHLGNRIGILRPSPLVIGDINKTRLKRQVGLSRFRQKMRKSLADCPPVGVPETVVPAEERKRIKASQQKPSSNKRIKPVKFSVEPIEDNLP